VSPRRRAPGTDRAWARAVADRRLERGALVGAAWSAGKSIASCARLRPASYARTFSPWRTPTWRSNGCAPRRCSAASRSTAAPPPRRRRHLPGPANRLIVNTVDLNSGMQVFWDRGTRRGMVRTPCSPPARCRDTFRPARFAGASTWTAPRWTIYPWARRASSALR